MHVHRRLFAFTFYRGTSVHWMNGGYVKRLFSSDLWKRKLLLVTCSSGFTLCFCVDRFQIKFAGYIQGKSVIYLLTYSL